MNVSHGHEIYCKLPLTFGFFGFGSDIVPVLTLLVPLIDSNCETCWLISVTRPARIVFCC